MIRRFAAWNAKMHRGRADRYDRRPYLMVGLMVLRGALRCAKALQATKALHATLRLQEETARRPAASRADHVASLSQLLREQEAAGSPAYIDGTDGTDTRRARNAAAAYDTASLPAARQEAVPPVDYMAAFPRSLDEWLHPANLAAVPVPGSAVYGAMLAWARHRQEVDPLFLGALDGHGLLGQAIAVLRTDEWSQQRAAAALLQDLGIEASSSGGMISVPFTWWVNGTEIIPDHPPTSSER